MTYTWTTERGAEIVLDIDTQLVTEKKVWADGDEVLVPCHEWRYAINSLTINGKNYAGAYKTSVGRFPNLTPAFCVGKVGKQNAYVVIPDDVENAIWGEEKAYKKAIMEKEAAVYEAYRKHYEAVRRMQDDDGDLT